MMNRRAGSSIFLSISGMTQSRGSVCNNDTCGLKLGQLHYSAFKKLSATQVVRAAADRSLASENSLYHGVRQGGHVYKRAAFRDDRADNGQGSRSPRSPYAAWFAGWAIDSGCIGKTCQAIQTLFCQGGKRPCSFTGAFGTDMVVRKAAACRPCRSTRRGILLRDALPGAQPRRLLLPAALTHGRCPPAAAIRRYAPAGKLCSGYWRKKRFGQHSST